MSGVLNLALPSKGRLQEETLAFFERAGLSIRQTRGARDYFGAVKDLPDVTVQFRSAGEIARLIGLGAVHLGVTGLDLLYETLGDESEVRESGELMRMVPKDTHIITPLGLGGATLVVAVPQAWLDVRDMADLADVAARFRLKHHRPLRVATKYIRLTRRFLAGHGVYDYVIAESGGATEGAPASGAAEFIVDITSSGRTLQENGLKIVEDGVIMRSEAALVAASEAQWDRSARAAAALLLSRIAADTKARAMRRIEAVFAADEESLTAMAARFGARVLARRENLVILVPSDGVQAAAAFLVEKGASLVTVTPVLSVFEADNPLYEGLERFLSKRNYAF